MGHQTDRDFYPNGDEGLRNERGRHLLESNGFVREGTLVREFYREGAYHDVVIYSVFRETPAPAPEPGA
jgi:hypothetical protein